MFALRRKEKIKSNPCKHIKNILISSPSLPRESHKLPVRIWPEQARMLPVHQLRRRLHHLVSLRHQKRCAGEPVLSPFEHNPMEGSVHPSIAPSLHQHHPYQLWLQY